MSEMETLKHKREETDAIAAKEEQESKKARTGKEKKPDADKKDTIAKAKEEPKPPASHSQKDPEPKKEETNRNYFKELEDEVKEE